VINGQKIWTSFGAERLLLPHLPHLADGPPHAGISEIIVPMDTPGIEVRPITDMTTNRHFCEVFFTDVRVPVENLVGTEGAAFKQTMRQLEHERGGIDRLVSATTRCTAWPRARRSPRPADPPGDRPARDASTASDASS
jgi:alkylation response protein AidB-like acyl-CoA dehydrogenase